MVCAKRYHVNSIADTLVKWWIGEMKGGRFS